MCRSYSSHESRVPALADAVAKLGACVPFPYQSTLRVMYIAAAIAPKLATAPTSRAYASTRKSTYMKA